MVYIFKGCVFIIMKCFRFFVIFSVIMLIAVTSVYAEEVTLYDNGYRGEGMVIAVIDSEFDLDHEMFALSGTTEPKLTEDDVHRIINEGLNCSQVIINGGLNPYINAKIPFAFNYAAEIVDTKSETESHGTHVAGIIAGNNVNGLERGFTGIAPEAQLILMKVTSFNGMFDSEALYQAYDDAVKLGADVINCSFGQYSGYVYGGFSYMDSIEYELTANAYKSFIELTAAVGNASRIGYKSVYYNEYNIINPLAANPDYGTSSAPAVFPHNISVAYANEGNNYKFTLSDGSEVLYGVTNVEFHKMFAGQTLEYVMIPNLGEPADYKGLAVKGKIAVVERGVITFDDKVAAAYKAGAVGILVYNNLPGEIDFTPVVTNEKIPFMMITQSDGMKFAANESEVRTVHIKSEPEPQDDVRMAKSSSWGATGMLTLGPDITAFGVNIYSSLTGNDYGILSGSSMSTPYISGCIALLKQHMKANDIEITDESMVRKYLMTAAEPIINPDNGVEYSPRLQGSGLVNMDNTYGLDVLLWNEDTGETKVELGEVSDTFEIKFNAQNLTDTDEIYKVDTKIITDGYFYHAETKKHFTADYSEMMKSAQVMVKDAPDGTVGILAGETVEIVITVKLSSMEIKKYERVFINGFFAEGFVYLTPYDGGASVSIPFMGYYGDWGEIPVVIDGYYKNVPYTVMPELGLNSTGIAGYTNDIGMLLVRDILVNRAEIQDADGEMLECLYNNDNGSVYYSKISEDYEESLSNYSFYWDGRDINNLRYVYPDGEYKLVVYYALPYKPDAEKVIEIPFVLDTAEPELTHYILNDTVLTLFLSDDNYLDTVSYNGVLTATGNDATAEIDLDISESLEIGDKFVYIHIIDAAGNVKTEKIPITD